MEQADSGGWFHGGLGTVNRNSQSNDLGDWNDLRFNVNGKSLTLSEWREYQKGKQQLSNNLEEKNNG